MIKMCIYTERRELLETVCPLILIERFAADVEIEGDLCFRLAGNLHVKKCKPAVYQFMGFCSRVS
jgi:hypothetical protein